ncbi:MAG: hypothetical protein NXI10_05170 [bacterium]|nr:hypothetical protein [bacterium]
MKYLILSLLLFSAFVGFSQPGVTIEGTYQGKNIFVQNPVISDGESRCITKVEVNGKEQKLVNSSDIFEIDLTVFGLKKGDPLFVRLTYTEGCTPKVMNMDAFTNESSRINSGSIKGGILKWKKEYPEDYAFRIEQYRWNKWVKVDVEIQGPDAEGYYTADINNEKHSGVNTFRIVTENPIGMKAYSSNFTAQGSPDPVSWKLVQGNREIEFTTETRYELYDEKGNLLLTGEGTNINLDSLTGTIFFLNFDNYTSKVELI